MKESCHVRVTNLPSCPELTRITVPLTADVSRMVSFRGNYNAFLVKRHPHLFFSSIFSCSGTVIRSTVPKLLETEAQFTCDKCDQTFTVEAEFEQCYTIPKPTRLVNHCDLWTDILCTMKDLQKFC